MTITFVMLKSCLVHWWRYLCLREIFNRLSNNSANEFRINPESHKTMKMAFRFTDTKLQWFLFICQMKMNLYTPPWNSVFFFKILESYNNAQLFIVLQKWPIVFCCWNIKMSIINSSQLYLKLEKLEIFKIMKRNHYRNSKALTHSFFSV